MEITGKIHCLFEQSGTFRDAFRELGYTAFCYDISDSFGKTDHVCDLFREIESAFNSEKSLFDTFEPSDLLLAFFPCTYFEGHQALFFQLEHYSYKNAPVREQVQLALQRLRERSRYHALLYQLFAVCCERRLRLVIENPASGPSYLKMNNFPSPTFIDWDRRRRGDFFKKPTAYWFINCMPTYGESYSKPLRQLSIVSLRHGKRGGVEVIDRSLISPNYARAFIHDFILGKPLPNSQLQLFV